MKANDKKTGKYVALLLAAIYLFVCLAYDFVLPKQNPFSAHSSYAINGSAASAFIVTDQGNSLVWLHKVYKPVLETKRNRLLSGLFSIALLGIFLLFAAEDLHGIGSFRHSRRFFRFRHQYFYLHHCTLRL